MADAEAAIEQLGLAPVTLIGHAMGALTAWQLAAKRPDLVRALIICDMRASALGAASQREWDGLVRRLARPLRHTRRRPEVVRRGRPLGGAARTRPAASSSPRSWTSARTAGVRSSRPGRCSCPGRPGCTTRTGRSWRRCSAPPWWSAASTASWAGRRRRRWSACCRAGGTRRCRTRGHLVHYDQPEAWRAAIEPFLDGVLTGLGRIRAGRRHRPAPGALPLADRRQDLRQPRLRLRRGQPQARPRDQRSVDRSQGQQHPRLGRPVPRRAARSSARAPARTAAPPRACRRRWRSRRVPPGRARRSCSRCPAGSSTGTARRPRPGRQHARPAGRRRGRAPPAGRSSRRAAPPSPP